MNTTCLAHEAKGMAEGQVTIPQKVPPVLGIDSEENITFIVDVECRGWIRARCEF